MNLRYISAIALLALPFPALAHDGEEAPADGARDSAITVVATGTAIRIDQTSQSIGVIGSEEIASVQGPDITRVLERLPGLTFARNGAQGGATSVFVRGASSEQLLVLVDGARINEVASPGGAYDFGGLSLRGIGKIELLRGSNSVVWGSDAIGGVLAMTTRELNGVEATAEYGARDSVDGQVDAGVTGERYSLTVNGGYTRTDGISSATSGTERDGFRQWRIGGRGRADLTESLSATLTGRYADSRAEIDGFPAPLYTFADTPEYQRTREGSGRAGLQYRGDALDLDAGFALSETRRATYDPTFRDDPSFSSKGRRARADVLGAWRATDELRVDFGADNEWSRFSTDTSGRKKARISSAHALLGWYGERLNVAAGVRVDDHSRFGSEWTFGANGSFMVVDGWRVRASYGEGFKAPTLYQLFSDYGNLALAPERSRSYDFGIEKGDRNAPLHFAVTGFRRDSRDLIDFVSCFGPAGNPLCAGRFGYYNNVARARAEGVEVELGAKISERFRAQAAYTYLKAENRTAATANFGKELARRPNHAVTVSTDWTTPLHDFALGADIRMVGNSFNDAGNFTRIDGYVLATLRASLPVNDVFEIYGRVENLTDESYETVAGYGTAGRSAFIGARARF
jgi:vitamin B12 transporter